VLDTYYTVLGVPEKATQEEIKTAYKELIKQVHPDAVPNASRYWMQIAEEKSKEVTEAYRILSNAAQRSLYDKNLADLRRASAPQPQQSPPQQARPHSQSNYAQTAHTSSMPPRQKGYNWAPLRGWAEKHPLLLIGSVLFTVVLAAVFSGDSKPKGVAETTGTQDKSAAQIASDYAARIHSQGPTSVPAPPSGITLDQTPKVAQGTTKKETAPVTVLWARAHGLKTDVTTKEEFCAAGAKRESEGTTEEEEGYCSSPLLYWEDFVKTQRVGGSATVKSVPRTTVTSFGAVEGPCCKLVVTNEFNGGLRRRCAFDLGSFPCGYYVNEQIAVLHKGDLLTLLEPICKRTPDGRGACHVKVNDGGWVGYVDDKFVELVENK
jgi:DnaJ domain